MTFSVGRTDMAIAHGDGVQDDEAGAYNVDDATDEGFDESTDGAGDPRNSVGRSFWSKLHRVFLRHIDGIPLITKLVACILVLLAIGTFGISFAIRQLVGNYLLDKADIQLRDQAPLIYNSARWLDERQDDEGGSGIPNDYFMQYRDVHNQIVYTPLVPVLKGGVVSEPKLPANGTMKGVELGRPFTTPSRLVNVPAGADAATLERAQAPWRVLALARQDRDDGGNLVVSQVVYIGISLSDQIDVVRTLTQDAVYVSIAIILIGATLGTVLVRRTLEPLKRIEKTAAKIAAGDLSQRVPSAPQNTEVGSLAASLNVMLARIESSFREQQDTTNKMKRFVSDASHELRTPLAAIQGYAELYTMQRELPGALERADDSIGHIKASSSRMSVLVEDLLSLARLDEGRGVDITQLVRLDRVFEDSADDLHALDPERDITKCALRTVPRSGSSPARLAFERGEFPEIEIRGDGSRLRQVFTNIVGNIHRYTTPDSPVEVALGEIVTTMGPELIQRLRPTVKSLQRILESSGPLEGTPGRHYAIAAIADHGPGVPLDQQPQIFERFYTADPSRARLKGGTGLGMSIVQSVVRAHHGFVCASTTPGGGLTLTIILPMGDRDGSTEQGVGQNRKANKASKAPWRQKGSKSMKTAKDSTASKERSTGAGEVGKGDDATRTR